MARKKDPRIAKMANDYIKSLQQNATISPRSNIMLASAGSQQDLPIRDFGFEQQDNEDFGIGTRILDVLSRPLYATAGFANATVSNLRKIAHEAGNSPGDVNAPTEAVNPFGAAWSGISGEKKDTFADVIKNAGQQKTDLNEAGTNLVAGVGGFVMDVVADPANLVIGGGVNAALRANQARKVKKATEVVAEAPSLGKNIVTGLETKPVDKFADTRRNSLPASAISDARNTASAKFEELAPTPKPSTKSSTTDSTTGTVVNGKLQVPSDWKGLKLGVNEKIGGPVDNSVADAIVAGANTPPSRVLPVPNAPRKAAQKTYLDGFQMGAKAQDFTSTAAKNVAARERAIVKPPSYIAEVNPDDYFAAVAKIAGQGEGTYIAASDLAKEMGIGYRDATRYMAMAEKDGIVTKRQINVPPDMKNNKNLMRPRRNESYRVISQEIPQGSVHWAEPRTPAIRAAEMYDEVLPEMRKHFDAEEAKGIHPRIESSDKTQFPISTSDIFETLPRRSVEELQFGAKGKGRDLYPSQWHAGAAEALRLSELGVDPAVRTAQVAHTMRAKTHANATRMQAIEQAGHIDEAAKILVENTDALAARLVDNIKRFHVKDTTDARAIAQTKADEVFNALENGTHKEAVESVANVGVDLSRAAREIGASDNAATAATHTIAPAIAKVADELDIKTARAAKAVERDRLKFGYGPQATQKANARNIGIYSSAQKSAEEYARELGIETLTLGEKVDFSNQIFREKLMHPLRTAFEFGYHTGDLATILRTGVDVTIQDTAKFRTLIAKELKTHGRQNIDQAWTAFRKNMPPVDPKIAAAHSGLVPLWNHVLGDNGLIGRLFRNGASIDDINYALKESKSSFRFKEPKTKGDFASVPEQWRDWDVKDPLSELEKINAAAHFTEGRQTVGASASSLGSTVPKPGYVKLRANELSSLGRYVDLSRYYPKEAGEYIQMLDKLAGSSTHFQGQTGAIAGFANNVIDPAMRLWKPFMTIARLGHHIRNLISDIMLSAFDGVMSLKPYKIARQALEAGGTLNKMGVKGLNALRDNVEVLKGSDTIMTYKGQPLSAQGFYKMAHDQGLLQNFHIREDIMEKAGSFTDKAMNNPYMRTMGKISETEGQYTRLAHFADKLMKGFSPEEAAKVVRKFHPDVRGLTPFETKYLRRLIPFYSWFRQSAPVVLSTMLVKPGRVTGVFKAEHNAAIAMGVDPESMTEPFPADKLYPSFIMDNIVGPIVGETGINIGSPQEGILGDTLNGSVWRNLAGMTNPVIKAPAEIASRSQWGTGANISDMSDYIDQQLPVVNQVANISGYSVTGLGDPQRQVEIGEKSHFFNTQMLNFLTGLGIQDYGKQSYKNIAGKERQ